MHICKQGDKSPTVLQASSWKRKGMNKDLKLNIPCRNWLMSALSALFWSTPFAGTCFVPLGGWTWWTCNECTWHASPHQRKKDGIQWPNDSNTMFCLQNNSNSLTRKQLCCIFEVFLCQLGRLVKQSSGQYGNAPAYDSSLDEHSNRCLGQPRLGSGRVKMFLTTQSYQTSYAILVYSSIGFKSRLLLR